MDFTLNYLEIVVAAVAAFVIGFLWHGPLFGKVWMNLSGITQAQMEEAKAKGMGAMAPQMACAFIQQLVVAAVLAHLITALGIADPVAAATLAFLLWLGFIATTLLNQVLWENKSLNLYLFGIVYHLVSLIVMAVIIVSL